MTYVPKIYRKQGGDELVVADGGTITIEDGGELKSDGSLDLSFASASTSGSVSVEPFVLETVMSGVGGVGGRARFQLDTNVALGGWANALKAYTKFGAAGKVTGLGSSICAEMDLSAGTVDGNYAPLEIELNLGTGAKTGTATALIYASVNGAAAGTFDDNGYLFNLQGVSAGSGHIFQAAAVSGVDSTHALKVKIGSTDYFIPLHTSAAFA